MQRNQECAALRQSHHRKVRECMSRTNTGNRNLIARLSRHESHGSATCTLYALIQASLRAKRVGIPLIRITSKITRSLREILHSQNARLRDSGAFFYACLPCNWLTSSLRTKSLLPIGTSSFPTLRMQIVTRQRRSMETDGSGILKCE